jgi:hypothetical protein
MREKFDVRSEKDAIVGAHQEPLKNIALDHRISALSDLNVDSRRLAKLSHHSRSYTVNCVNAKAMPVNCRALDPVSPC